MKIFTLLGLGLVIGWSGCSFVSTADKVEGSGVVQTEKRSLASFTTLDINCPSSIQVRSQEQASLEISGDDNILPLITTEVKDDTLYIRASKEYDPQKKVQIIITTPDLRRFVFAGAGEANLAKIKNDRLEIVMEGAGDLTVSGETNEADITLSGAGSVDAKNLHAVNAKVNSTGVGSVDLYATGQLDAKVLGVGEINYFGRPKVVNREALGIGSINER